MIDPRQFPQRPDEGFLCAILRRAVLAAALAAYAVSKMWETIGWTLAYAASGVKPAEWPTWTVPLSKNANEYPDEEPFSVQTLADSKAAAKRHGALHSVAGRMTIGRYEEM